MPSDFAELIPFLKTREGSELLSFVASLGEDAPTRYAALRRRRPEMDPDEAWFVAELPELRRRARAKFPEADRLFLLREPLEQATARPVALYRASRFQGCANALDLCAGLGGDAFAIASVAGAVTAVENNPQVHSCLAANAAVLGPNVTAVLENAEAFVRTAGRFDAVMFDPSRRRAGRRMKTPLLTVPPFDLWREVVGRVSDRMVVKLSPLVPESELPGECDVQYVSFQGECRELAVWLGDWAGGVRRATRVVSEDGRALSIEQPRREAPLRPDISAHVAGYLYDPDPSVIRSGLLGVLAAQTGLQGIDPSIAFLTGPQPVASPFLTGFRVLEVDTYNDKRLRQALRQRDVGRLTVLIRGFPGRPEDVARRLRLKGPNRAVLILTRISGRHYSILAEPCAAEARATDVQQSDPLGRASQGTSG